MWKLMVFLRQEKTGQRGVGGVGHAAQPNSLLFLRGSAAEEMDSIHSSSTASVLRLTHARCLADNQRL